MSPHIQEASISEPSSTSVNGNAAKLTLSLRDVIFLLVLIAGIAGNFFATQARLTALAEAMQDMRQDFREQIHEIRGVIERKP